MRVSAINLAYTKPRFTNVSPRKNELQSPVEQAKTDSVSFKGIKNALRMGSLYALGGAFVGLISCVGMGLLAGAATMAGIAGGAGVVAGLMHNDKTNILKD